MTPATKTTRSLEHFLAFVGMATCVIVCVRIWQVLSASQPMWPLPDLYLLEMMAVCSIGLFSLVKSEAERSRLIAALPWITVGVLAAFVVMGAWSIGWLFLPIAVIFASAASLASRRQHRNMVIQIGVGVLAAIVQVLLMFTVIRLLYPY